MLSKQACRAMFHSLRYTWHIRLLFTLLWRMNSRWIALIVLSRALWHKLLRLFSLLANHWSNIPIGQVTLYSTHAVSQRWIDEHIRSFNLNVIAADIFLTRCIGRALHRARHIVDETLYHVILRHDLVRWRDLFLSSEPHRFNCVLNLTWICEFALW